MSEPRDNKGYERRKGEVKKVKTCVIRGIIIVVITVFLIIRISREEELAAPTLGPVVMVQLLVMSDIELTTNLMGAIEPADAVHIYPKADDDITVANIKAEDAVVAGQVLVEINTKQATMSKNAMDIAKAAWDDAVLTLNHMVSLHASGFVSDKELEGYQMATGVKYLQYESAKIGYETQMEFSYVTPPTDSRVEQLDVELHGAVGSSMQTCVVTRGDGNNATFYITERMKNSLSLGALVTVIKEGNRCGSSVVEINNMTEASVGLFKVKVSVDDQETMAPGTNVEIQVPSVPARNVMLIPNHCVYYKSRDAYVHTYDQVEGMTHEVPVEVGIFGSENIPILSGLTLDDMVLTTRTSELEEGIRVTLDTEAGEDAGQTDKAESSAADISVAQQKKAAKWT